MIKNKKTIIILSILLLLLLPVSIAYGQVITFSDGFESGDSLAWDGQTLNAGDALNIVTTDPYHGTYHAEANILGDGSGKALLYKTVNMGTIYTGGMFQFKTALPGDNEGFSVIDVFAGATPTMVSRASFRRVGARRVLRLNYMSGDSLLATDFDYDFELDTWYNVELYTNIDGTNGEYKLFVNGVEQISVSGIDSDNYGSVTEVRTGVTYSGAPAHQVYFDAYTISDSYIGDKVFTLTTGIDGKGTIITSPNGPYEPGSDVSVTASPSPGWVFAGWSRDLSGITNPTTINMNSNKTVIATFTSLGDVTVTTSKTSYNRLENLITRIRDGTFNGDVMLQINRGSTLVWMDQRTLDASGNLDYTLKIPSSWSDGTYTIYIKDTDSETSDTATFGTYTVEVLG
ncbi:hypothetical protein ACFL0D_04260, partial [Thermoproteota archaeon]